MTDGKLYVIIDWETRDVVAVFDRREVAEIFADGYNHSAITAASIEELPSIYSYTM